MGDVVIMNMDLKTLTLENRVDDDGTCNQNIECKISIFEDLDRSISTTENDIEPATEGQNTENSSIVIQNNELVVENAETDNSKNTKKTNMEISQCDDDYVIANDNSDGTENHLHTYDHVIANNNYDYNNGPENHICGDVPTPLLRNFSRQVSYRYPPFISREESCSHHGSGERTLHKSRSLPDIAFHAVDFQRNCSCDCHHGFLNRQCSNISALKMTGPERPDFILDVNQIGPAASYIPSGPSRQLSVIANMSTSSSPTSSQAPPHYRSLIFSILQDEPPKYQDVTGKALSMDLVSETIF